MAAEAEARHPKLATYNAHQLATCAGGEWGGLWYLARSAGCAGLGRAAVPTETTIHVLGAGLVDSLWKSTVEMPDNLKARAAQAHAPCASQEGGGICPAWMCCLESRTI